MKYLKRFESEYNYLGYREISSNEYYPINGGYSFELSEVKYIIEYMKSIDNDEYYFCVKDFVGYKGNGTTEYTFHELEGYKGGDIYKFEADFDVNNKYNYYFVLTIEAFRDKEEWFYVKCDSNSSFLRDRYYKCDQIQGLIELINFKTKKEPTS